MHLKNRNPSGIGWNFDKRYVKKSTWTKAFKDSMVMQGTDDALVTKIQGNVVEGTRGEKPRKRWIDATF